MNFLIHPNLPESKVKTVAIGEGNNVIVQELQSHGIEVIELKNNKNLLGSLSRHADMLMFDNGNGIFFIDEAQIELCEKINKWGGTANKIKIQENARYPDDVLLNAASIGDYLICNTKTVSKAILNSTKQKFIDVKQGYTKCSTCVVNSQAIITDDISIYNAAKKHIDVLLIKKGDIQLEGFNYGFIGGASFKLDKNVLAFTGKLKTHSDADKIKSFISNYSIDIIELSNEKLEDIGGIIPLGVE